MFLVPTTSQTNRPNILGELHGLSQLQQCNIMIVSFRIEIPMSNDGRHRSHLCWRLRGGGLVMIAQDDSDLGPFESPHAMGGREDVVLGEEGAATVEMTVVEDPCHPGVVVDAGGVAAHYAVLVVRAATFCGERCEGVYLVFFLYSRNQEFERRNRDRTKR